MTNEPQVPVSPLKAACTCFYLRRAARTISREYDRWLKPTGLKTTQFTLLSVASATGPLSITDLAAQLGMERTSLTRNLRPLEERGLIAVSPEGWKRTRLVELTDAGREILNQALPLWGQAQHAVTERMGAESAEELRKLLQAAIAESEV